MGHKIILSRVKLCNLNKHVLKTLAHMAGDLLTREMLWIPFSLYCATAHFSWGL